MLIEIHAIQNHSPANLNRDDLGAPKTCYFGGALRSRISSQCLKRSIRLSPHFGKLLGGVRTRQLARLIAEAAGDSDGLQKKAEKLLEDCGFKQKQGRKKKNEDDLVDSPEQTNSLIFTTREAIREMADLLRNGNGRPDKEVAMALAKLIETRTAVPDMALSGRMLEPAVTEVSKKFDATVEAALQVAHAISTHEARPEVDYYVAADDIPGDNHGAGFVGEALFASACFYKYFSIHWETLVKNLGGDEKMAAHTVGAFIRAAAMTNPTGKQNSFAAHNPPDGLLVEIKDAPISYANAFARPVDREQRDLVSQSIAQLAQYVHDLDTGFGKPRERFWFSPNLRQPLTVVEDKRDVEVSANNIVSLDELIGSVVAAVGHDWQAVQSAVVNPEVA